MTVVKMESCLLVILMMMIIVQPIHIVQGACIEEERKTLLEIKASLVDLYDSHIQFLPSWVDLIHDGTTNDGGECCDWERVKCNTTTQHITELSLDYLNWMKFGYGKKIWPLNFSLFLHFEELTSLKLSNNYLDDGIMNIELKRLSSLKKLKILDLGSNFNINNRVIPSLSALTSLIYLNLEDANFKGYFPINDLAALENLETLDLTYCGLTGFEKVRVMKKLKTLNIGWNNFNESPIALLSSAFPSLETLSLQSNYQRAFFETHFLSGSFPTQDLARLTNLKKLDLSGNNLKYTPGIRDCKSLSKLKRLESISLGGNNFNKSIISCLSSLPSLKALDLHDSLSMGTSFPIQEISSLRELETLDMSYCGLKSPLTISKELPNFSHLKVLNLSGNDFNGRIIEALASFHHLEVLHLSGNNLVGSIPSAIWALSSLTAISFAHNKLNGSLPDPGLCELKNLHELDLSHNMFDGNLPQCFNNLSSLKFLDISSNQFTGMLLPSVISSLTSLEYVDFSYNKFEGTFSLSSFSNNKKLEVVQFIGDNDKFELDTEEPIGWIPMFQLKALVLSNCNMNRAKGNVVPSFLHYQHSLKMLDLSQNSLDGQFPSWLIENNKMLEGLYLRNNSFSGNICMPMHRNDYTYDLDISGNHINGTIPDDIPKFLPNIQYLDLSSNKLSGAIPSSVVDLGDIWMLYLSDNELSEVPNGLFTKTLMELKLSNNRLHGEIFSGNLSLGIDMLYLDSNCFTGKIGNVSGHPVFFDISNNLFTGTFPSWMGNMSNNYNTNLELVIRNNMFEGGFPCGSGSFVYLDISENYFSGSIPSCKNWQNVKHLHLGSNRFTGSIPNSFRYLRDVLTLDIGYNNLSGTIPKFLGELSTIRILLLRNNNFSGPIPKQLCQLKNVTFIDLSNNSLSGSVPRCLHHIASPVHLAFTQQLIMAYNHQYKYESVVNAELGSFIHGIYEPQDEVQITTKSLTLTYKGKILDYMSGLDLSCNKLTGEIPKELGLLNQIHTLNLSHNQLTGPIPVTFTNLSNIESLDLSSNGLTGKIPSELIKLNFLVDFDVSYNNLSGRLPDWTAQFCTFTIHSYEGNPLLCGPPLEKKCTTASPKTKPSPEEEEGSEKLFDMDTACFYGSFCSTLVVFMLGFAALLYTNPYWRRRWLDLIEECMCACYYFIYDSVIGKLSMVFHN